MRFVVELDVLDCAVGSSDNTFVVLVIHLSGDDRVFSLDPRDHVSVIGWHDLGAFVSVADDAALGSGNDNL